MPCPDCAQRDAEHAAALAAYAETAAQWMLEAKAQWEMREKRGDDFGHKWVAACDMAHNFERERDALRDQLTRQRAEVLDEVETTLRNHGVSGAWLRARLREMKAQPPTSGSE